MALKYTKVDPNLAMEALLSGSVPAS